MHCGCDAQQARVMMRAHKALHSAFTSAGSAHNELQLYLRSALSTVTTPQEEAGHPLRSLLILAGQDPLDWSAKQPKSPSVRAC
eukprot:1158988-Pelagomonas_calceolata.AAC.17